MTTNATPTQKFICDKVSVNRKRLEEFKKKRGTNNQSNNAESTGGKPASNR